MKVRVTKDIEYKDINDSVFAAIANRCAQYSLTIKRGVEPFYALYKAVEYISTRQIPGDIVECGVWRGGSMMLSAMTLRHHHDTERDLHLLDTYEGNPEPQDIDLDWNGESPHNLWKQHQEKGSKWGYGGSLEEVRKNLHTTGYPKERMHFVKGMVEDTLPDAAPDQIALLRLDTKFFSSTAHELDTLYPNLVPGGVLLIDDYGFYQGARKATDEYLEKHNCKVLLNRIDPSVRIGVKVA